MPSGLRPHHHLDGHDDDGTGAAALQDEEALLSAQLAIYVGVLANMRTGLT